MFDDAAVTATEDSLYFGSGFEGVSGRANRQELMRRVLGHLDVLGGRDDDGDDDSDDDD